MNTQCGQTQPLPRQMVSSKNLIAFEVKTLSAWVSQAFCKGKKIFSTWQQRAKGRHLLASMTPAQAKDIGLNLNDLRQEANKEFWQA